MDLTIGQLEDLIDGISENNKSEQTDTKVLTGSKAINALKEMSIK